MQIDVSFRPGVVVDGDWNIHPVTLRERDGQIEIDEEILKDFETGGAAAERAMDGGRHHSHPPGGDRIGHWDRDGGSSVLIGDDLRIDVKGFREIRTHMRCRSRIRLQPYVVSQDYRGSAASTKDC